MMLLSALHRLYAHVPARRRRQLVGLAVLMLLGAAAELVTLGAVAPFLAVMAQPEKALELSLTRDLFGVFGWTTASEILLPATLLFIAIAVSAALIRIGLVLSTQRFAQRLAGDMGAEVYRRTLYQPYRFHVARNSSEIIASINKVQTVLSEVITPIIHGAVAFVLSIAILTVLFLIDAVVASAAAVSFGLAYFAITRVARSRLRRNSATISHTYSRRVQAVQEGLGAIRDILLDGSQQVHVDRFRRVNDAHLEAHLTNSIIAASPRYMMEAIGVSLIAAIAYVTTLREGGLLAALPVLGALALGAQRLMPLLQQIYQAWTQLAGSEQVTVDVIELLEQPMPDARTWRLDEEAMFRRELELRDVWFRYNPSAPWVLQGIDLRIRRGARVGVTGKTGSGKSTLLDLIMGLLEPTRGTLSVDGMEISGAAMRAWQSRIAHVPQSIFLSDASIAENIAFGIESADIDHERVRLAARAAHIADFIEASPEGYSMVVGERGVRLSGGQRQRIGLARALYRGVEVLVLDEATSALDDATESDVMIAVENLHETVTVIIVAHRLSTLSGCDMVVRIEGGRIASSQPAAAVGVPISPR